jgi:hypothetical protein
MRTLIAFLAVLLIRAAWAIDPPRPQAPPVPAPSAQSQAEPSPAPVTERPDISEDEAAAKAKAEAEVEEELPPLPADLVPAGPPPARFNPTEKVRADFPVSFPIDI